MNNPSVFFSVVYPQALPFLRDLRNSALSQSRRDFDFIVVNDGCEEAQVEENLKGLNLTILKAEGGFSANRLQGINYARSNGYEYILFCDADDSFAANRYERTIEEFSRSHADIIVCNLNITNQELKPVISNYFSKELPESQVIDANFVQDKNVFGMSNTAIRLAALDDDIRLPETPIVDWYLFTVLLIRGLKAHYITDALVNYRQYNSNMIGINKFDIASFRRLSVLKRNHYKILSESGYPQYHHLEKNCETLQNLSDTEIEKVIKHNLYAHPQPLWWQIISK